MLLRSISAGAVTGTDTLQLPNRILGGVLITADGTNNAVVSVRTENSSGDEIFELTTKSPIFITGPISNNGKQTVYISVSGTGAAAQFYEWVQ